MMNSIYAMHPRHLFLILLLSLCLSAARPGRPARKAKVRPVPLPVALEKTLLPRVNWGAHVVRLRDGKVLFTRNADHFFTPASNTKLFSTALALTKLGPEFRWETLLSSNVTPKAGVLAGDLTLHGSGDPTMSARPWPFAPDGASSNPMLAMDEFTQQLAAQGIRRITGNIVGDDTIWVHEPFANGWAEDDGSYEYGARVSALTFADNAVRLRLIPGAADGETVGVISEPFEFLSLENQLVTGNDGGVNSERVSGAQTVRQRQSSRWQRE
jgi:serine-type D-Ala-D-Ala carboxypeptidase/endopeptidase (penicillin-binding protein 4)